MRAPAKNRRQRRPVMALSGSVVVAWLLVAAGVQAQTPNPGQGETAPAATGPSSTSADTLWPSIGPLWSALSGEERRVLAPFEKQWNSWPVEEKKAWVLVARTRYPGMSEAERLAWHQRIEQWAALTPEQRRNARLNYRLIRRLPATQQAEEVRRFQSLTPEQRQVLETTGTTSNTAAGHAGARTGLAKQASQPMSGVATPVRINH